MRLPLGKASLAALLAAGLSAMFWGFGPHAGAADRELRSGVAKTGFDAKVRPQDDLFRHVNGGWIAEAEIPAESAARSAPSSSSATRREATSARSSRTPPPGPTTRPAPRPARSATCTPASWTRSRAEELGLEPIEADLARIDAIADKAGLHPHCWPSSSARVSAGCSGCSSPPTPSSRTGTSSTSTRAGSACPTSRTTATPKFKPIREAFVAHVEKMFELAGWPDAEGRGRAGDGRGDRLAKDHWDRVKSRDRHAHLQQEGPQGARRADPRLRLGGLASRRIGRQGHRRGRRPPARATSRRWPRRSTRSRSTTGRPGSTWHVLHDAAPCSEQAVRRRELRLLRQDADRRPGDPPALEAGRGGRRGGAGRGGRQALRRQALPARGQGADAGAGRAT